MAHMLFLSCAAGERAIYDSCEQVQGGWSHCTPRSWGLHHHDARQAAWAYAEPL